MMSAGAAEAYHSEQIETFRQTEADMVTAITMNYVEEAVGVARAAMTADMPVAISFTVETDGRLPTGQSLKSAIEAVDAATGKAPAYYMVNCAHPTHFAGILTAGEPWVERIRGIRANASKRSHAELDAATDLDAGDPIELGMQYRELLDRLPHINVLGGCCGTDHRHVEAIAHSCSPEARRAAYAAGHRERAPLPYGEGLGEGKCPARLAQDQARTSILEDDCRGRFPAHRPSGLLAASVEDGRCCRTRSSHAPRAAARIACRREARGAARGRAAHIAAPTSCSRSRPAIPPPCAPRSSSRRRAFAIAAAVLSPAF
jgi:hypothetical protein